MYIYKIEQFTLPAAISTYAGMMYKVTFPGPRHEGIEGD
jgi:hypothetical protein